VEFAEWDTRVAAYAVVVDSHDRLLLTWYNGPGHTLNGRCPAGELTSRSRLEAAVVREVTEVTGYDVAPG
jgi:8-oxo-dGTP diphosphatase